MDILQIILTSILSAASLFVIAKLIGHKQIAQLDFFDYITGITIGSIAAEFATELEAPYRPFISMVVYGIISLLLGYFSRKYNKARKFINGTPTILMNNGKLYRENFKKSKLELSEFMVMCRQLGYFHLKDIQTVVFECNGKLSILPVSDKQPLTPCDMNIQVDADKIETELIIDGKTLNENLMRMGLDEIWLKKQLNANGYKSEQDIFLATIDANNEISIYKK